MQNESEKLSVVEKAGYSLGDCAANFVFQTQIIFMLYFYTDVFRIDAEAVATLFLVSNLWDAINDPLMGAIADRTKTRWGRFRPWVLLTAVPFAIAFVLTYTVPDFGTTGKLIWAYATYNALKMIYTANNIPYSALTGVLTADPVERTSLSSWRFFFAMIAGFLVQTFTDKLVKAFGGENEALGYQLTIGLWAAIAVVFFVVTFLTARERVEPDPRQKSSILQDLKDLSGNVNWITLAVATVFVFIYLSMRGGVTKYYFDYSVARQEPFSLLLFTLTPFGLFNALSMIGNLTGILFSKPISMRFGKRNTFRVCLFFTAVLTALFYFLRPDAIGPIYALQITLQFVYGITIPLLWAMMADVADNSEWKTGRRATAMTFAATVFALKFGLSIGTWLSGRLLSYYQYVPKAEQSERALEGIRLMMSIFPAVAFFVAVVALFFYRIDKSMELEMHDALAERRKHYQQA